jgi:hypothetical protein
MISGKTKTGVRHRHFVTSASRLDRRIVGPMLTLEAGTAILYVSATPGERPRRGRGVSHREFRLGAGDIARQRQRHDSGKLACARSQSSG